MPNEDDDLKGMGMGALLSPLDTRDFVFAGPDQEFDWELGFDIELLLGYRAYCKDEKEFWGSRGREGWGVDRYREIVDIVKKKNIKPVKLVVNDQSSSGSCTGQATSKYLEVLNFLETAIYIRISAKDVYKWVSVGYGQGAYSRDAVARAIKPGVAEEKLVPSYGLNSEPKGEDWYLTPYVETQEIHDSRLKLLGKSYNAIKFGANWMDVFAWSALINFGGYYATVVHKNSGWSGKYPKIGEPRGSHAIFYGKAKLIDGKPFIGHLNSWGKNVGDNGWQWLGKEFFAGDGLGVREGFTIMDLSNDLNLRKGIIMDFYKIKGEATIVIRDASGKYFPIATPPELWKYVENKYALEGKVFPELTRAQVEANMGGIAEVDIYLKSK